MSSLHAILLLAAAYTAHALAQNATSSALAADIPRCYRFEVTDSFCKEFDHWEKHDVRRWIWQRDVLRKNLVSDMVTVLESHLKLTQRPVHDIHGSDRWSGRARQWILPKVQAGRPDLDIDYDGAQNCWECKPHMALRARYPVNQTQLRAAVPCRDIFVERWTDMQEKIFRDYAFTDWHYKPVACPRHVLGA